MKNGLAVANFLEKHPFVDKVIHPGKFIMHRITVKVRLGRFYDPI